jgi:hypothetical protein
VAAWLPPALVAAEGLALPPVVIAAEVVEAVTAELAAAPDDVAVDEAADSLREGEPDTVTALAELDVVATALDEAALDEAALDEAALVAAALDEIDGAPLDAAAELAPLGAVAAEPPQPTSSGSRQ